MYEVVAVLGLGAIGRERKRNHSFVFTIFLAANRLIVACCVRI